MDWLHRVIEAAQAQAQAQAQAPADAAAGASDAWGCARKNGFEADVLDSRLDTTRRGLCRRLRRL